MAFRVRTDGLRVRRTDDGGLVVYDERTDVGHVLNPSTAFVFDACDGYSSPEDIARRLATRFDLPADVEVVYVAIADLRDRGLLDENIETTRALDEMPAGLSRRDVIKRLALGAAAVAAFPSIVTIADVSRVAAQAGLSVFAAVPIAAESTGSPVTMTLLATGVPGAGAVSFEVVSGPDHGTATIAGDQLTYAPAAGFIGVDNIVYRALYSDGTTTTIAPTTTAAPTTAAPTTAAPTTAPPTTLGGASIKSVASRKAAGKAVADALVASVPATITITVSATPKFTG